MSNYQVDANQASTQFLYSTVRIETLDLDGSPGSGTAFFFEDFKSPDDRASYLVTNNHVLANTKSVRLTLHVGATTDRSHFSVAEERSFDFAEPLTLWKAHPNPEVDLCALSVKRLKELAGDHLDDLFFIPIGSHGIPTQEEERRYSAILSLVMIGYPNGLWDERNNLPVLRRGTTATHPAVDFNGKPEVVIDMACFPGSSGSPVVFYDPPYFASAHRFLGVLYAGPAISNVGEVIIKEIPTSTMVHAITPTMMHLGYVIKAREVMTLVRSFK